MNRSVLLIEDDPSVAALIERSLGERGFRVIARKTGASGLDAAMRDPPGAIIQDLALPDMDGLTVIRQLRQRNCQALVILVTSYGSERVQARALEAGADIYLEKPVGPSDLVHLLEKARPVPEGSSRSMLVGRSRALEEALTRVENLARTDLPILVEGESGTGKELVAQILHNSGPRRRAPFVVIDPSAVPETLLESSLFGHERGAFTGAVTRVKGVFEQATGGTLVIDEIGNLSYVLQGKLLRALQERRITPLGAGRSVPVDVRLVSSTNADLAVSVRNGTFRLDLYHRLKGARILLPPLRDRKEDIPALVDHFLLACHPGPSSPGRRISGEAMALLQSYRWPGNVRELKHAVSFAHCMAGEEIHPIDLPEEIQRGTDGMAPFDVLDVDVLDRYIEHAIGTGRLDLKHLVAEVVERIERHVFDRLMPGRTQAQVADLTGIHAGTLSRKLRALGIVSAATPSLDRTTRAGAPVPGRDDRPFMDGSDMHGSAA